MISFRKDSLRYLKTFVITSMKVLLKDGYSHKEISQMVNISEGTSKSNLARARIILQRRVGSYTGLKKKISNG